MNEAVNNIVSDLNRIQRKALSGDFTNADRVEWRSLCDRLREQGFKPKCRRVVGSTTWYVVPLAGTRNTEAPFVFTNVRPDHKCLRGDCTTRAMTYALNGLMTYDEIQAEQYRLAAESHLHVRRNTRGVWEKVLTSRGWQKVTLARLVKRSVLAARLRGLITHAVVSTSRGHCAVIDVEGNVRDLWDSRGGRVSEILIHGDDCERVCRSLQLRVEDWIVGPR